MFELTDNPLNFSTDTLERRMPDSQTEPSNPSDAASADGGVRFVTKKTGLTSAEIWEYDAATNRTSRDVVAETLQALAAPDDFPPIEAAIVAGDRVALAVDPNVPDVDAVIEGVLRMLRSTPAEQIEIVVWDEATEQTLQRIRAAAGEHAVIPHQSDIRESLCYLAADVDAEPIYLNRALVDADFVLPIVAIRPSNLSQRRDLTGVFPSLSDSATRTRFADKISSGVASSPAMKSGNTIAEEVPWLLGVQLILGVTANSDGAAGEIHAGTLEAFAKRITPTLRRPDPVPPPAALVVAALDGDAQQQTWENVARAAEAALAYALPDATIVIWSSLDQPPEGALLAIDQDDEEPPATTQHGDDSETLPPRDRFSELARTLKRVTEQHRLMLHSNLPREVVEPLGLGVIESPHELANLSRHFQSCGVLRAASFAGGH
ncbi:hypothetical protein Enr13x_64050 [Stieleria neptunia]|uniref:Uncharacterized protein n=1 Tax=Stieleria neptunia TaxID=2527979 RepID=A0A518I052_9BACT|nr:lactate racemase domain-containing protein [Stieleria neptunia]QDV46496.1 hypothetical protein Enr13x_64050 [Stieleria neptunia]